jgi:hypothetical protein
MAPATIVIDAQRLYEMLRTQRGCILVTQSLVRNDCVRWLHAQYAIANHPGVHVDVQMRHLLVGCHSNGVPSLGSETPRRRHA